MRETKGEELVRESLARMSLVNSEKMRSLFNPKQQIPRESNVHSIATYASFANDKTFNAALQETDQR